MHLQAFLDHIPCGISHFIEQWGRERIVVIWLFHSGIKMNCSIDLINDSTIPRNESALRFGWFFLFYLVSSLCYLSLFCFSNMTDHFQSNWLCFFVVTPALHNLCSSSTPHCLQGKVVNVSPGQVDAILQSAIAANS